MDHQFSVIIVEDEPRILSSISKKVQALMPDIQVAGTAENGKQALQLLSTCPCDLILTDIQMPVMNGLDLAKAVRLQYPQIMIVIISGYDTFEYAQRAIKYNVLDYLLKPINDAELLACLKTNMAKKKTETYYAGITVAGLSATAANPVGLYYAALLQIGNIPEQVYPKTRVWFRSLLMSLQFPALLDDVFASNLEYHFFHTDLVNQVFFLFGSQTTALSAADVCGAVYDAINRELKKRSIAINVSMYFAPKAILYADSHLSVYVLQEYIHQNHIIGMSNVQMIESKPPEKNQSYRLLSIEDELHLKQLMQQNSTSAFLAYIDGLLSSWVENRPPQRFFTRYINYLLLLICRHYFEYCDFEYEMSSLESSDYFSKAGEIGACKEVVINIVKGIIDDTAPTASPGSKQAVYRQPNDYNDAAQSVATITNPINAIEKYLEEHYSENIDLAQLSSIFGYEKSYLVRLYH